MTDTGEEFGVDFPDGAFEAVAREYTDRDACWLREALQNARDAGASRADVTIEDDGAVRRVTVADDGRGMDWDTLKRGLLTYAGSVKPAGAAGGFGMAKNFLVFAPARVVVSTRAEGRGPIAVEVRGVRCRRLPDGLCAVPEGKTGTVLSAELDQSRPADVRITPSAAGLHFLMARCDMRGMKVCLHGTRVPDGGLRAEDDALTASFAESGAKAYYWKRRKGFQSPDGGAVAVVTHRGVWVRDLPLPDDVKGRLWVELDRNATACLNAARTDLATYWQRREIEQWIGRINQGAAGTLKTKRYVKRYDGALSVAADAVRRAEDSALWAVQCDDAPRTVAAKLALAAGAFGGAMDYGGGERLAPAAAADPKLAEERAAAAFGDSPARTTLTQKARTLAWRPALMVANERDQAAPPKLLPGRMAPRAAALLRAWMELARQFLLWAGESRPFGVGWVLSDDAAAQFREESDGTVWVLLNPLDAEDRLKFKTGDRGDRCRLVALACHEAAHALAGSATVHGDAFATAYDRLAALAVRHAGLLDRIIRAAARKA